MKLFGQRAIIYRGTANLQGILEVEAAGENIKQVLEKTEEK
jgi:hypothetical protein